MKVWPASIVDSHVGDSARVGRGRCRCRCEIRASVTPTMTKKSSTHLERCSRSHSPPSFLGGPIAAELKCCAAARSGRDASVSNTTQRKILRHLSVDLSWNLTARFHRTTLEAHLAEDSPAGTPSRLKVLSRFSSVVLESPFGEPFSPSRSFRLRG